MITMKIQLTSVMVDDHDKALAFYTDILGSVKKAELPVDEYKWLTVVSPDGPDDIELTLEPAGYPFARTFQQELFAKGIPATAFAVDDIQAEYERLRNLGVEFTAEPTPQGPV